MAIKTSDLVASDEVVKSPLGLQYYDAPFYTDLLSCVSCQCRAEALQVVPGTGPKSAEFIFLGRNPGRDEDKMGQPFIGPGGRELDRMLEALGFDRLKIAILNTVKCHTMGDRPPKPIEIETCTNRWLEQEFAFFDKAKVVFPMGQEAIKALLGPSAESPARREGYWVKISVAGRLFLVCPLNHPGYLLRARGKQMQMYNTTLPSVKKFLMENLRTMYDRAAI